MAQAVEVQVLSRAPKQKTAKAVFCLTIMRHSGMVRIETDTVRVLCEL
ncbi:MAG: hypothetical protein QG579_236 [Patescibacteria group bacterium]|nr:hypothetical protein [Patescibacteria group bacterium]